jgi:hypothetical protein
MIMTDRILREIEQSEFIRIRMDPSRLEKCKCK